MGYERGQIHCVVLDLERSEAGAAEVDQHEVIYKAQN